MVDLTNLQTIFYQTTISEELCKNLSLDDLTAIMNTNGWTTLKCTYPVNDPDGQVKSMNEINALTTLIIKNIERLGSGSTFVQLAGAGYNDAVKCIAEAGANLDYLIDGNSALVHAADNGKYETVKLLLSLGSKTGIDKALLTAGESNNFLITKLLLENGANPNHQSDLDRNTTPLMLACYKGNIEIVKLLIDHGADLELISSDSVTALSMVIINDHEQILDLLLSHKVNIRKQVPDLPLTLAVKHNRPNMVKKLVERGASPNQCDESGKPPLYSAVENNNENMIKLLVQLGARPNQKIENNTLLLKAVRDREYNTIKLLLQLGADPNLGYVFMGSPFVPMLATNDPKIKSLLREYGAK